MALEQFGGIYKGKKVFITGHTGFKGSWLSMWLLSLGAKVTGYSNNIPTTPSHIEGLGLKMKNITGDVRDKAALEKAILSEKPDIVFHLAAQPLVRLSYKEPAATMETNIMGTVNVFEAARKSKTVKAIVNVTSDKCYKNIETQKPYKESDALGGNDPYSASKAASEIVSQSYRVSFFNPNSFGKDHSTLAANVRAGNVIGGGDWALDRLVPDIMKAAHEKKEALIRNPLSTRPWQHILEPLSGYLLIGQKLLEGKKEFSDDWNFGPATSASQHVGVIAQELAKHWEKVRIVTGDVKGHHEAKLLTLDSSKAKKVLGWHGIWTAKEAAKRAALWYKYFYESDKVLSETDLEDYIKEAAEKKLPWVTQK